MKKMDCLSLRFDGEVLFYLDQTLLPHEERWCPVRSVNESIEAIKMLRVRGAPLIGVFAGLSLAIAAQEGLSRDKLRTEALRLRESRPTAVNLMMAIDRMLHALESDIDPIPALENEAQRLFDEDVRLCEEMGTVGASLIQDGDQVLTHCNTGGLATVGIGTALGVIRKAHESGKKIHVFVDETRPLLQGGRLTTWELQKLGIPYTLICDNMAASLMAKKLITKVFLGADRIALNGDFANKIGTYGVAVLAQYHGVPFYPVAPYTTLDPKLESGNEIVIEMRGDSEVRREWAPKTSVTYNPAFDVTPVGLVTGLVLNTQYYSRGELQSGVLKRQFS